MNIESLLIKYHLRQTTETETREVLQWLEETPDNRLQFEELKKIWEHAAVAGQFGQIDLEADWEIVANQTLNKAKIVTLETSPNRFRWGRVAAVIGFLLLASVAIYPFIFPAKTTISWVSNEGPSIKKVTFDDGSVAYLNHASSIGIPSSFSKAERNIQLKGEAFFEVESDAAHPFRIDHGTSATVVLGTQFNLSAFEEENEVIVDVIEGKVRLQSSENELDAVTIHTGESAVFLKSEQTFQLNAEANPNAMAWKTKKLVFDGSDYAEVFQTLSAYYQVSFQLRDGVSLENCELNNEFDQLSLPQVIEELEALLGGTFIQEGNTYTLTSTQSKCK